MDNSLTAFTLKGSYWIVRANTTTGVPAPDHAGPISRFAPTRLKRKRLTKTNSKTKTKTKTNTNTKTKTKTNSKTKTKTIEYALGFVSMLLGLVSGIIILFIIEDKLQCN